MENHLLGILVGLIVAGGGFMLFKYGVGEGFSFFLPGMAMVSASKKKREQIPAWARTLKRWVPLGIMLCGFVTAAANAYKAILDAVAPHGTR